LYPGKNFHGNENDTNDASVSVVVTYGDESVLLTGDLPSKHEAELLQDSLPHGVTIYKAGHHGSKYSSGDQLLSYIKPEYAVISAGKDNKYGHPNEETLARLTTYSKEILSTIDRGTISFLLDGETVTLKTDR
jgi:competence protein ComEC